MRHAPGPWTRKTRKDGLVNIYSGSTDVALCVRPRDADIIEAAPLMLEALKQIYDDAAHSLATEADAAAEILRANAVQIQKTALAAIAAATGKG